MRLLRTFSMIALLFAAAAFASDETKVTRIFYLQDIDTREAVTLLRVHAQVRQIAEVPDLPLLVVVTDVSDRVNHCESVLRERNAFVKAIDPHGPQPPDSTDESSTETRVFRLRGIDRKAAATVLRAMYGIRKITESSDEGAIVVTAPAAKLEMSQALLNTLGVLETTTEG